MPEDLGRALADVAVGEAHAVERDRRVGGHGGRRRLGHRAQRDDADEAGERGAGLLGGVELEQHGADRVEQAVEVQGGGRRRADRDRAVVHQQEADDEHRPEPDQLGGVEAGEEERPHLGGRPGHVDRGLGAGLDAVEVQRLQPERPDRPGADHARVQLLGAGALGRPLGGVQRAGAPQVPPGGDRLDRQGGQPGQRQAPVQRREPHDGQHDDQRERDDLGDRGAGRLGHRVHVAHHPGHQVAGAALLDLGERHVERPLDHPLPQAGEQGLAQPPDQRLAPGHEHALGDDGDDEEQRQAVEVAGRPALLDHVHDLAEQAGDGERRAGRGHEDHGGERHEPAAGAGHLDHGPPRVAGRGDGQPGQRGQALGGCPGAHWRTLRDARNERSALRAGYRTVLMVRSRRSLTSAPPCGNGRRRRPARRASPRRRPARRARRRRGRPPRAAWGWR
jgi:hypothetical protein